MGVLRRELEQRRAPLVAAVIALLLLSPSLGAGYLLDDHTFQLTMHPDTRAAGLGRAGWDLFNFEDGRGDHFAAARARGIWPWWVAPDFRLAFFRPLSSAIHALEFRHLRAYPGLQHAHSLLWYAALVLVVGALHRRLFGVGITAGAATFLYAIDDAHAFPALWITHRNALIALTLGLAALLQWERRAIPGGDARTPPWWVGPLLFAVALLGGEAAFGALAWIVSHALLRDPRPRSARLRDIAPYAVVALAWLVTNRALGYGARGGGFYIDPARQPAEFLGAVLARMPLLLASQFALPPADLWMQQPPAAQHKAAAALGVMLLVWALWLRRALAGDPRVPYLLLGTLLSLVPVCATWPADRLLLASGFGAFALLSLAVTGPRATTALRVVVLLAHCVAAMLLLPLKAIGIPRMFGGIVDRAARSLPFGGDLSRSEVIALTAPDLLTPLYASAVHQASREGGTPRAMRILAVHTSGELRVRRTDPRALEITLSDGFMHDVMSQVMRGRPWRFRVGEAIDAGTLTVTALALNAEGRPARARFAFARSLEDPTYRWTRWQGRRFVPWSPPPLGGEIALPPIDLGRAMAPNP